jgi:hypothetical protein
MEAIDQVTGFDQHGRACLDCCNDDRISLTQMIATGLHHMCDLSSRRHFLQLLVGRTIGAAATGCPFAHDA